MSPMLDRVEAHIREHDLIPPGGEVACLVSGGADSTCLRHALDALGYRVSAVHVAHGLRGAESDEDARHCAAHLGAQIVEAPSGSEPQGSSEAALRELRYRLTERPGLRATGHTASDQVESVLLGIVASGSPQAIKVRREDGVVRPLLPLWREETEAYCREHRLPFRVDASNPGTKRGLIRDELLPLLDRLDPRARTSLVSLATRSERRLPRAIERSLAELLASTAGTKSRDLGGGVRAVREYDTLRLEGEVTWGPWTISSDEEGLEVRTRRPGDRLAGRSRKLQDVLVDAKVPRAERDSWPVVVRDGEVVAVPGVLESPGVVATRVGA